jgi:glycosyltransferase involved in cell wall biosynthesis
VHTFKGVFAAKNIRPDILHIHNIGPSLCVSLARLLGLRVVVTHQGPDYKRKKWGKFARLVLRIGEFAGCVCANQIIVVSEYIARRVRNKYNKNPVVIYNGVVTAEALKSDDALQKYQLTKGRYILTVGRFVPEKGFDDLVAAFNRIEISGWKLVIVGRADCEDRYSKALLKKALGNKNIILTGFLSRKPLWELYSHAGLFVLSSYYEGMSIALLEAMSYGLPCLVSDIPANRGIQLPKENYFKPGDIDELAGKISKLIVTPFSEEDKKRQIKMVAEKYDWEKIADQTLKVYEKVVNAV